MKEKDNISEINKELEGFSKLQGLKGKQPFQVPDSYFESLEDDIMSKIAIEPVASARRIRLSTKQVLYYVAAASIVAIFIFIALRSQNHSMNQNPIANNPTNTIETPNALADKGEEIIPKSVLNNSVNKADSESIIKVEPKGESTLAVDDNNTPINKVYNSPNEKPNTKSSREEDEIENIDIADNGASFDNMSSSTIVNGQSVAQHENMGSSTYYTSAAARKAVKNNLFLGEDCCSNKAVYLNALIEDARNIKYLWSTDDTTAAITVNKSGNYWVKIFDLKNVLLASDTIRVDILKTPHPNLGEDRSICNYESTLISSGCKDSDYSYKWSVSDATTPEVYLSDMEPGVYNITLSVMTCADTVSSTMILTVKDCNLEIPNVITPNGDGRNDRFVIKGLDNYSGSQLHILDRNGRIVYESMDYQNDWDANNIPAGTYFYRLQLNDGKKSEKNGTLTIIR